MSADAESIELFEEDDCIDVVLDRSPVDASDADSVETDFIESKDTNEFDFTLIVDTSLVSHCMILDI